MRYKYYFPLFLTTCTLLLATVVIADTLVKNDGEELKGIVVEDYKDRIVMSTASGEKTIMKSGIKELYYAEEEDNLIKLGDQAKEKRDYIRALTYYDMAFKKNPDSQAAKDGLVFLEGYLFRKEQAQKEEDIKRREDLERQGMAAAVRPDEGITEKTAALKKAIGITLEIRDGLPYITSVQPNSPASEAGMAKGDRLVAIWARLTGYMGLDEVLDALLDKPSLEIKCTVEKTIEIAVNPNRIITFGTNELIGASFTMEFDGLTVSSVKPGGASAEAGLNPGDLVTSIDGQPTRYMPLNNAVRAIKNSKDKNVKLIVRRAALLWRRD